MKIRKFFIILIVILAVDVALTVCLLYGRYFAVSPITESHAEPEPNLELDDYEEPIWIETEYPVGSFIITTQRKDYQDGDMILEIPRLELSAPVINGTDEDSLKKGVGLFDYAQLPGPYNSNVSIAGHRDIFGKEFYFIDTLTTGDMIYLYFENKKHTYEYVETFITNDSDWEPIRVKEDARVTLQSCDPIGTSLNRIFVIGRLAKTEENSTASTPSFADERGEEDSPAVELPDTPVLQSAAPKVLTEPPEKVENGQVVGSISIPAVGLSDTLAVGTSLNGAQRVLEKYAAMMHYEYMGLPEQAAVSVIGGHNYMEFNKLKNAAIGDEVILYLDWGIYSYVVYDILIIPTMSSAPRGTLVLYTCYPFDEWNNPTENAYFLCRLKVYTE